ncbi:endonuclease/exonuclease/phosphatase family protein [Actinocatenispora rupis]|uniref:Teicoplanin resistance protein VanJ n=1 Tax=Actinocatenispora rupis TaxID=519421 RepID=A0A8J3JEV8_9ACTN|nr:endonuclease/exonuclease/phosphatase family protein [Actinocatenispora rupis]GID15414.1 teicoplanin resistance protein VanJ [Actinocatenispora rupis]
MSTTLPRLTSPAPPHRYRRTRVGPWRRGLVLAALALLLGLLLVGHTWIPNRNGHLGSLVETFLPWYGLVVPVLLVGALCRRSATAAVAVLVPALVWLSLFGGLLVDKAGPGSQLTVVSHNVGAGNPDPAHTARVLAASGADLVALEELTPQATATYEATLAGTYRYHVVRGTVGMWSRLPLSDDGPPGQMDPSRAMRATVTTDHGRLAVYVVHLWSVRVSPGEGFSAGGRDAGADALGAALAADPAERVLVLGDLNGTLNDRAFAGLTAQLRSAQAVAGHGFGFSWPATFPVARIDQILVRGVQPTRSWTLPATGSDHLPVAAGIRW